MFPDSRWANDKTEQMKALNLAYAGDAVFELYVRDCILEKHPEARVHALHVMGSSVSNCTFQAGLLAKVRPMLRGEEESVVRRGLNSKPHSFPRNAPRTIYIEATAFEALLGYVYLSGDEKRLTAILETVRPDIESALDHKTEDRE